MSWEADAVAAKPSQLIDPATVLASMRAMGTAGAGAVFPNSDPLQNFVAAGRPKFLAAEPSANGSNQAVRYLRLASAPSVSDVSFNVTFTLSEKSRYRLP